MQKSLPPTRGIAILSTLLLLGLLMGLLAAFIMVSRAGNQFTVSSLQRSKAKEVASAATNYAWYHLELDRAWGADTAVSGPETYPYTDPFLHLEATQADHLVTAPGQFSSSADFSKPEATFILRVENNLGQRSTLTGFDGPVPARSVKLSVDVTVGGITNRMVTMLRPVPLSHDSLSAGKNINLDSTAGLVRIESRDPYINRIRANEDLNLPAASDVRFLKHGIASAFHNLNVGGMNLSAASDEAVRQAGEESGGVYLPLTGDPAPDLKPFDPNKITLPQTSTAIPPGTWTYDDAIKVEYIPHNLTYATPPATPFSPPGIGHMTRHQKKTSTYDRLRAPNGQTYVAGGSKPGTTVLDPPGPPAPFYGSEGAAESYGYDDTSDAGFDTPISGGESDVHTLYPGFQVNVRTAQMVVHPHYRLDTGGDFLVKGESGRLPELYFGYKLTPGGVAIQKSLVDGIKAAQDHPEKYMAAIVASGDVNVTGGVVGYGSMIAGGTLTIKASSGLRIAPELGVVVKGKQIVVNPATEPEPALPGEPVDADYPIFRDAIQQDTGGDWSGYNAWLDNDEATRTTLITSLRTQGTGSDASTLWATLCTQIESTLPLPNLSSYGWSPGAITVGQYVRLKEFLQTRASGYNGGAGDDTWLDPGKRTEDVSGRVAGVVNGIAQWARSYKQSFQQFLNTPTQTPPDMFFTGLMYADEDLKINAPNKTVRLEGAVVARTGTMTIGDAKGVDLVYNRTLLDDVTAMGNVGPIQLERVFSTLD